MPALLILLLAALAMVGGCASSRANQSVNRDWKFVRQDAPGAQSPDFNDSSWQKVTLPHTWNNLDGQDGGDDYYRGPGWYRKRLKIDSADAGKSFFLRFEGAATMTEVFVNGKSAGVHGGNFGAFCFDVTDLIKPGAENILAVRVDNTHFDDIPPLSGDFTIFGGLYRDVHLLIRDPLSISPLDDASPGVYLKQAHVDDASAEVEITTKLRNGYPSARMATVVCTIVDHDGKVVTKASVEQSVEAKSTADAIAHVTVSRPHLWDGRNDPYLYQAIIEVKDGETVTDRSTQPLGLRYFHVDAQKGLILNGKHYSLHGVNRHQDRLDKGWAIGPKEHEEDFRLIMEMGCTGVRLAHFQQSDYSFSLCNRLGLAVWAENGLVNKVNPSAAFAESAKQQLRELIKQNYNHPSILFWSLYNELALAKDENHEPYRKLVTELNDLSHALDTTRPTVAATHKPGGEPVNWIPDLTAFNRYYGWYSSTPDAWARGLDELHAAYPDKRIGISEYGAGASIRQHEAKPATRPRTSGVWHPEEWQGITHEAAWGAMKDRPWLWCTFLWNMFDFAADARKEGDQFGRNDKGLVSFDRKVRKDAFYFYKASWSDEPVVRITSRRFNPRPSGPAEIKVYSNCDSVELFVDGHSQGKKESPDRVFIWPGVVLRDGKNKVLAVGIKAGRTYRDEVIWNASRTATTRLTITDAEAVKSSK